MSKLGVLLQGYSGGMRGSFGIHSPDDYNGADMSGFGDTSSDVRSPTRTSTDVRSPTRTSTEVRSPTRTSTSTRAHTRGNVTVTGGAGAGATSVTILGQPLALHEPAENESNDTESPAQTISGYMAALGEYSAYDGLGDLDPGAILPPSRDVLEAETKKLRANVKQLAADWLESDGNSVSQGQLAMWRNFVDDVNSWDWGPSFLAHVWGPTWRDEIIAFQYRFNDFANEWRSVGVNVTVPGFTFKAAPPSMLEKIIDKGTKPIADTASTIKWAVIGLGGLAAAYIFYLTYETARTGRAIAPRVVRNPRRRRKRR